MAVELLAILVRKSTSIEGIQVADHQTKLSQYADDTTFFIRNRPSLVALLDLLTKFADYSGLRINTDKSHLLLLGNHLHPPSCFLGINIVDNVTILGITFANNMSEETQYQLNFKTKLQKIRDVCSTWCNRNLSLKGKTVLVNSLLISILQYPCTCIATPPRVYVEFKKIVLDFLWNSGRNKIAYNLMVQDIPDGGLKLADLETRIKVIHLNWIKFMWNNPTAIITKFAQERVGLPTPEALIISKLDISHALDGRHSFLQQIFKTWAKYHISQPQTETEVQTEPLWYNTSILIAMEPVHWPSWERAGINFINDLLHQEEPRFLSHTEINSKFGINCSFIQVWQI